MVGRALRGARTSKSKVEDFVSRADGGPGRVADDGDARRGRRRELLEEGREPRARRRAARRVDVLAGVRGDAGLGHAAEVDARRGRRSDGAEERGRGVRAARARAAELDEARVRDDARARERGARRVHRPQERRAVDDVGRAEGGERRRLLRALEGHLAQAQRAQSVAVVRAHLDGGHGVVVLRGAARRQPGSPRLRALADRAFLTLC